MNEIKCILCTHNGLQKYIGGLECNSCFANAINITPHVTISNLMINGQDVIKAKLKIN